eukprot:GHVU01005001.1.p2 GENE.GHVU01005001.1~~GHVU01005001.1.p2  ORF type:complete len:125 (-),score=10.35 GHVU01005001.1:176-550(-)
MCAVRKREFRPCVCACRFSVSCYCFCAAYMHACERAHACVRAPVCDREVVEAALRRKSAAPIPPVTGRLTPACLTAAAGCRPTWEGGTMNAWTVARRFRFLFLFLLLLLQQQVDFRVFRPFDDR